MMLSLPEFALATNLIETHPGELNKLATVDPVELLIDAAFEKLHCTLVIVSLHD